MRKTIAGRRPDVAPEQLIEDLVPPPHFADASFDSYVPDPEFVSQAEARDAMNKVADAVMSPRVKRRGQTPTAIYLDGGFGVGKTHLLVSLARAAGSHAAYGSFVQFTNLVGVVGFQRARAALQEFRIVCIDEFELDDPGDTLLMARLMRELADAGVVLAVTSNTVPGALGEGRFAASDFAREIQGLASQFVNVRIDGPDYRHREDTTFPPPLNSEEVVALCASDATTCDEWESLVADLIHVHPSRYGALVRDVTLAGLVGVAPLDDQGVALRVVALVDRLYDNDVRIAASGQSLETIFPPEMLAGGYRKKYLRALSRLGAMAQAAHDGAGHVP